MPSQVSIIAFSIALDYVCFGCVSCSRLEGFLLGLIGFSGRVSNTCGKTSRSSIVYGICVGNEMIAKTIFVIIKRSLAVDDIFRE
ncbi:unnamed protein product [Periconia digitata]|uniref:Uncharacterized protein n=1 Tax=Periconia digitata TaxID=1303443 RepID=A0A9W4U555_9PLEO|nr:unnamed protein product [Periconia digitata]